MEYWTVETEPRGDDDNGPPSGTGVPDRIVRGGEVDVRRTGPNKYNLKQAVGDGAQIVAVYVPPGNGIVSDRTYFHHNFEYDDEDVPTIAAPLGGSGSNETTDNVCEGRQDPTEPDELDGSCLN